MLLCIFYCVCVHIMFRAFSYCHTGATVTCALIKGRLDFFLLVWDWDIPVFKLWAVMLLVETYSVVLLLLINCQKISKRLTKASFAFATFATDLDAGDRENKATHEREGPWNVHKWRFCSYTKLVKILRIKNITSWTILSYSSINPFMRSVNH